MGDSLEPVGMTNRPIGPVQLRGLGSGQCTTALITGAKYFHAIGDLVRQMPTQICNPRGTVIQTLTLSAIGIQERRVPLRLQIGLSRKAFK